MTRKTTFPRIPEDPYTTVGKPLVSYADKGKPAKPKEPKPHAQKARFTGRRQPDFMAWVNEESQEPCVASERQDVMGRCGGILERAHLKSRGAGGQDIGNVVRACTVHHKRLHSVGQRQFEYELGRKLRVIARKLASRYLDWLAGKVST